MFDIRERAGRPPVPVAYTTFGERPHQRPDGTWHPGRPTILESLTDGGLGELAELVHETGHAIHIAGIRTRPAFADWPDSDALTEALGDLVAASVHDPAWQRRWLPGGVAAPAEAARRGSFAETALDAAWALFEIRLHETPDRVPNDLWTEITSTWLGIAPHPEWSWWAMRGQLVEEPGYMANYAIGAVLAADLRAAIRAARGDWLDGDPGWYAWVREHVYRFGRERSSRDVLRDVLGRPPSADALRAELDGVRADRLNPRYHRPGVRPRPSARPPPPASRWSPSVVLPRLPGLIVGLILFGIGIALMAEAGMGLGPWEAFHQGIARLTGLQLGTVSILLGIPILLAWYPLGERPGVGTVINIVLIGTATNVALGILPHVHRPAPAAPRDARRRRDDRDRQRPLPRLGPRARAARRAHDRAPLPLRLVDPALAHRRRGHRSSSWAS